MRKNRNIEGKLDVIYDDTIEMLDDITFFKILNESVKCKESKINNCFRYELSNEACIYLSIENKYYKFSSFTYEMFFNLDTNSISLQIIKYKYPKKEVDNE